MKISMTPDHAAALKFAQGLAKPSHQYSVPRLNNLSQCYLEVVEQLAGLRAQGEATAGITFTKEEIAAACVEFEAHSKGFRGKVEHLPLGWRFSLPIPSWRPQAPDMFYVGGPSLVRVFTAAPVAAVLAEPKNKKEAAIQKAGNLRTTQQQQHSLMLFDPQTGDATPYPSEACQYRLWHGLTAWLFNPWTGQRRLPGDIGTDVQGVAILPPGEPVYA